MLESTPTTSCPPSSLDAVRVRKAPVVWKFSVSSLEVDVPDAVPVGDGSSVLTGVIDSTYRPSLDLKMTTGGGRTAGADLMAGVGWVRMVGVYG